jgi:predicted dehydrogenase
VRITSRDPAPPPLAYVEVSGGIFLDMTIHDFDMARFVTGSEVVEVFARGTVRIDPAFDEAGDVDTAVVMLEHENGCLTTIDNSRQAAYGYDQRVEVFGSLGVAASVNPLAPHRSCPHRYGDAGDDASLLLPGALHAELSARVAGVRRGGDHRDQAAGDRSRRAGAARDRPRGVAVGARGSAGAARGGGHGVTGPFGQMRLDGKVVIVTGSTQGLGAAIARRVAELGAAGVVVTGRNAERGEAVRSSLGSDAVLRAGRARGAG